MRRRRGCPVMPCRRPPDDWWGGVGPARGGGLLILSASPWVTPAGCPPLANPGTGKPTAVLHNRTALKATGWQAGLPVAPTQPPWRPAGSCEGRPPHAARPRGGGWKKTQPPRGGSRTCGRPRRGRRAPDPRPTGSAQDIHGGCLKKETLHLHGAGAPPKDAIGAAVGGQRRTSNHMPQPREPRRVLASTRTPSTGDAAPLLMTSSTGDPPPPAIFWSHSDRESDHMTPRPPRCSCRRGSAASPALLPTKATPVACSQRAHPAGVSRKEGRGGPAGAASTDYLTPPFLFCPHDYVAPPNTHPTALCLQSRRGGSHADQGWRGASDARCNGALSPPTHGC